MVAHRSIESLLQELIQAIQAGGGEEGGGLSIAQTAEAVQTGVGNYGAATAALQTTGNTTLSTIAGSVATAANQATANGHLSSIASGGATAANQATANGHLSTLAGSITTGKSQVDVKTVTLADTIRNNQVTVTTAGTRVQLTGSSITLKSGVHVKASINNTGTIFVGDSGVSSSNGYRLNAGESVFLEIDNLNKIWVDASANSSLVSYLGS